MATDIGKVDFGNAGTVGQKNVSRAELRNLRLGQYGELVVSEAWGKYGELCKNGYVYAARGPTAAAIPIFSTLTNSPTLWNPAGSGKIVMPLKLLLSVGAIGTPILFGAVMAYLANAGAAAGTGAPVPTFTNVAPANLLLGRGSASSTLYSPAVVTFTVQPTVVADLGMGHFLEGAAATGQLYTLVYDFDGSVIIPPSTLISIGATIASSTTFNTTILFAEMPAPVDY